jgi:predicted O-methyltransferase YrrM
MTMPYNVADLKQFTDRVGRTYGTEDWCIFMYALAKMHAPKCILELGCGVGACSLWLAQAMRENGAGHVYTVDDGRDWAAVLVENTGIFTPEETHLDFGDYLRYLRERFGLTEQLTHLPTSLPPFPVMDQPIDLLFSDFMHGPNDILQILGTYLSSMAPSSSIFIDSASTSFPSYALLELLVPQLNQGRMPQMLLEFVHPTQHEACVALVRNSRFDLIHMTEQKRRAQNSTAWIKIQPLDLRAYPRTVFH